MFGFSDGKEDFDVLGPMSRFVKSYPPSVLEHFPLSKARLWRFGIRGVSSLNSSGFVLPMLDGVMVIQW